MSIGFMDPIAKLLGPWASVLCAESVVLRVLLAVLLSAVIGAERSNKRHSAGMRTFILVSLATVMSMLMDQYFISAYNSGIPVLSAAAIIGMGMMSNNSILFSSRNRIKGLTTSIGLWTCGILGLTVGAGFYTLTLAASASMFLILSFLPAFELRLKNRSNHFDIHLELADRTRIQDFTATLRKLGLRIDDIEANPSYMNTGLCVYSISLTIIGSDLKKYRTHNEIIEALGSLDYVHYIEEMN